MEAHVPAAKRQKTSANPKQTSAAGPSGAAGGTVDLEAHCRALEMQNANLKEQLAATQQQLKEASASVTSAAGTAKKAQAPAKLEELVYSPEQHSNFLRTARRVPAIGLLDISGLDRTSSSFAGGPFSMKILFGKPQWRSDKKIDAVLAALTAGTDNVERLDLGDAPWATEFKYAKDLVKLLRKYKKSLTSLRITMRALANAIDVIGALPNLAKLELVVNSVDNHFSAYGGEFQTERMAFGSKKPKVSFAKIKDIELYLSRIGGGYDETEDDRLPDLLEHRKDVITHLDFTDFKKTRVHLPIEDLFASLTKLRSISLRSEFLHIIKEMKVLKELELHVVGGAAAATLEELSPVLSAVEVLAVQVGPAVEPAAADALLEAMARLCSGRTEMSLVGAGWRDAAVGCMLRTGSAALRCVRLAKCAGVQAHHLSLLSSLTQLQEIALPQRLKTAVQPEVLRSCAAVKILWE
ncbi:hypothetical protein FOCC_FOCC009010 [Frankliniella occidentalis]|nr:hypothetical protein FOCC_FOCC009010 [Frankliniella occidentalis]